MLSVHTPEFTLSCIFLNATLDFAYLYFKFHSIKTHTNLIHLSIQKLGSTNHHGMLWFPSDDNQYINPQVLSSLPILYRMTESYLNSLRKIIFMQHPFTKTNVLFSFVCPLSHTSVIHLTASSLKC